MNNQTLDQKQTNSNGKKFSIGPAPHDDTGEILGARWNCLADSRLSFGARCLFCLLLDLALNPDTYDPRSAVVISVQKLAEFLGSSVNAVLLWKRQLVIHRWIWVKNVFRPNMWPMHRISIYALIPPGEKFDNLAHDGLWGNGARRQAKGEQDTPPKKYDGAFSGQKSQFGPNTPKKCDSPPPKSTIANLTECDSQSQKSGIGNTRKLGLGVAQNAIGSPKKGGLPVPKNGACQSQKPQIIRETVDGVKAPLDQDHSSIKGEGKPQPPQKKVFKDDYGAWEARLPKLFPRELKELREGLNSKLLAVKQAAKSIDFAASTLRPKTAEWLGYVDRQIEQLSKSTAENDRVRLPEVKRLRAEALRDPKSYSELQLTLEARSSIELLKRKIASVEAALEGPAQ